MVVPLNFFFFFYILQSNGLLGSARKLDLVLLYVPETLFDKNTI